MRILFLTQVLPYPPDSGPRIKTWNVIRYLSQLGYQIILATYVRQEEERFVDEVRKVCMEVHPIPLRRSRIADAGYWLRSQFSERPFLVERDNQKLMTELVGSLMSGWNIDVIHADQLTMAQFAMPALAARTFNSPDSSKPFTIFDAHNAVWLIIDRLRENSNLLLKPFLSAELNRIRSYEGMIVREFDSTIAVSEADRQALEEVAVNEFGGFKAEGGERASIVDRITVVPIGVDTSEMRSIKRRLRSRRVLALGTLHYPPNADGIRWFASEVFPGVVRDVPDATLTIVGKNPPSDIKNLEKNNSGAIRVTGYVPDLSPYFESAALMVVPVRAGGGMRVRILEGFGRGLPMVTTSVGLEGIDAVPDQDILVADSPFAFQRAVVRLLKDRDLRARLASNGRRVVERVYDSQVALQPLGEIYEDIAINKARAMTVSY